MARRGGDGEFGEVESRCELVCLLFGDFRELRAPIAQAHKDRSRHRGSVSLEVKCERVHEWSGGVLLEVRSDVGSPALVS